MYFVKNKSSIKYYILAFVTLLCVYSSNISQLFEPIFDNIYYGNLVKLFTSVTNIIIWSVEFIVIILVCKKLKIEIFTQKDKKGKEMPLWQLCALFVLVLLPMIVISVYLNFKIKLVYSLGIKITSVNLTCNIWEIITNIMRVALLVLFIRFIQTGIETNVKFKKNIVIPWGAIFLSLTVGLIDFFVFPIDLKWFYLFCTFYYGIIYLVADRRFLLSVVLCYLIWLL